MVRLVSSFHKPKSSFKLTYLKNRYYVMIIIVVNFYLPDKFKMLYSYRYNQAFILLHKC